MTGFPLGFVLSGVILSYLEFMNVHGSPCYDLRGKMTVSSAAGGSTI